MSDPHFHVVLIEPEIPQNAGTIGRMCVATKSSLHLVKPLGFSIDAKAVLRAGLDYWEHLDLRVHESLDDFMNTLPQNAPLVLIETRAGKTIYEHAFAPGSYLIFGKETTGIPEWFLQQQSQHLARIPMFDARVRSINLSNSVGIALYEAIRQSTA